MLALFYFKAASPTPKSAAIGLFAVVPIPCGHWKLPLLSLTENFDKTSLLPDKDLVKAETTPLVAFQIYF